MTLRSLVVVILVSAMVTGCDFGNHERRVYAGVCVMPSQRTGSAAHVETDIVSQNRCAKSDALYAYTSDTRKFRIWPATQHVVSYDADGGADASALQGCTVVDADNWNCKGPVPGVTWYMQDGAFRESGYYMQNEVFMPAWHWWFLRLIGRAVSDKDLGH